MPQQLPVEYLKPHQPAQQLRSRLVSEREPRQAPLALASATEKDLYWVCSSCAVLLPAVFRSNMACSRALANRFEYLCGARWREFITRRTSFFPTSKCNTRSAPACPTPEATGCKAPSGKIDLKAENLPPLNIMYRSTLGSINVLMPGTKFHTRAIDSESLPALLQKFKESGIRLYKGN